MKRQFFTSLLFLLGCYFTLSAQRNIDVEHYRFEVLLNDQSDSIKGKATITLKFLKDTSAFYLDLTNVNGQGKGMTAYRVLEKNEPVSSIHGNDSLHIKLGNMARAGEKRTFEVLYAGIPSDGLIISKNKYGHRTFFADNWPNRGHNWLPCVDDPADKASVEFIVTAPQHYQVVANGIQVEETNLPGDKKITHWKEEVTVSTKVMVIGVADFAVNLSGVVNNCIPVYSWVYPEDRNNGFYDYAQAAEILPYFIKNVGPYAYKKLANVESKTIFGGLENANTIFYSESSINGKRKSEGLLAHEIAHQWFGNMATEKTFAHLWLSEGFATYMTILYMEDKYGADTAQKMLQEDRQQVIEFVKTSDRTVVDNNPNYMQLLNPNSYQKGGWILHMLRRQLGDSAFWKSIRKYYATYAGKTADTEDLRKVFEEISGKDFKNFFQQWLYTPGLPKLEIKWKYVAKENKTYITVTQLQKNLFQFPLELHIQATSGKPQWQTVQVSKQTETFAIPVKEKTFEIYPDPKTLLLFEGKVISQ